MNYKNQIIIGSVNRFCNKCENIFLHNRVSVAKLGIVNKCSKCAFVSTNSDLQNKIEQNISKNKKYRGKK